MRFDAPYARLVGRMRLLEIVDFVICGDGARVVDKPIGHPARGFDLVRY